MSKILKFSFLIGFLFILLSYCSYTYAASVNMNLNTTSTGTTQDTTTSRKTSISHTS